MATTRLRMSPDQAAQYGEYVELVIHQEFPQGGPPPGLVQQTVATWAVKADPQGELIVDQPQTAKWKLMPQPGGCGLVRLQCCRVVVSAADNRRLARVNNRIGLYEQNRGLGGSGSVPPFLYRIVVDTQGWEASDPEHHLGGVGDEHRKPLFTTSLSRVDAILAKYGEFAQVTKAALGQLEWSEGR
jgi:hypothetical protein